MLEVLARFGHLHYTVKVLRVPVFLQVVAPIAVEGGWVTWSHFGITSAAEVNSKMLAAQA